MLGFIFAVAGMIVAMFLSSVFFGVVPLVSIIGAFFTGGVAGIMGNTRGGRVGAMVAGFIYGVELILFSGFTYKLFNHFAAVGAEGTGHDCIDAMALMTFMKNPIVGIVIIVAAFILMSVLEVRHKKKSFKTVE
jgi:PTS system ascorbate-specific IIC component